MCDCLVALGPNTARGATILGKNSDREKDEPQPIQLVPGLAHPRQSSLQTTYLEIPQVPQTARVLGSGPYWTWGFEQGVNEHGVAIGNETVFTHEELELPDRGLLGMDLVRLGLERARSAREAVEVITGLIETYGQGGPGWVHLRLGYSNGFLIADPAESWILQTSSRRWAAKRVGAFDAISNHPCIGTDWDLLSDDAEVFAIQRGWWKADGTRFDFAAAYRSTKLVTRAFSDSRQTRAREMLEKTEGPFDSETFMAILRDHGSQNDHPCTDDREDPRYFTICAHNEIQQHTTASMVAPLDRRVSFFALTTPCSSVYLPLFIDGELPAALGEFEDRERSLWWHLKRLQTVVESDFANHLPRVRAAFDPLEARWLQTELDRPTERMHEAVERTWETCKTLLATL